MQRGAHDDGIAVAAQGLQLASHGGTDDWVCWYATTFGHYYSARVSEGQEAEAHLDRAADARREPYAAGKAVLTMAGNRAMTGTQEPEEYLSRGRHLAAVLRNVSLERDADWAAGHVAWRRWRLDKEQWRIDEARQHFARALALGQRMGERFTTSETRWSLANIAIAVKQPGAGPELRDALAELWTIRAWSFWMGAELAAFELLNWDRAEAGGRGARLPRGARNPSRHTPRTAPTGARPPCAPARIGSMDASRGRARTRSDSQLPLHRPGGPGRPRISLRRDSLPPRLRLIRRRRGGSSKQ